MIKLNDINRLLALFSVIFYSTIWNISMAQSLANPFAVQVKSPEVAGIEKVGLVPTSLNTGQINPGISIYTLSTPEIDIPVNLTYSNSGLKIGENATWVGWGWNLFVGGVISQNIKGISDEGSGGLLSVLANTDMLKFLRNQMSQFERDTYIQNVTDRLEDSERDLFTFNFLGRSGTFFFDSSGTIRQLQRSDLKITASISNNQFDNFTVTDEKGIKYLFSTREISSYSEMEVTSNYPTVINGASWYLSSITTPNNDVITFSYENDITFTEQHNSYSLSFGASGNSSGCAVEYSMNNVNLNQSFPIASQKKVKEISCAYGKIIFNTTAIREDLKNSSGQKGNALSEIVIQNQFGDIVKKAQFVYGYFSSNLLKLKTLSLCGTDCSNPLSYQFTYHNENSPFFPPLQSLSKDFDHWGYYNGANNISALPTFNSYNISGVGGMYYAADKNSNSQYSQNGMLESIKYPTGGTSEFEYEGNMVDMSGYDNSSMPLFFNITSADLQHYEVGGNRIKSITYSDPVTGNQNKKIYEYSVENTLKYVPNYLSTKENIIEVANQASFKSCGSTFFVSDRPQNSMPGFHIEYSYVLVKEEANSANGYTKITFSKSEDVGSPGQPFPTIINIGWIAGQPLLTESFKKEATNSFTKIQQSTTNYNSFYYTPMSIGLNSVKISRRITGTNVFNPQGISYYETGLYSYFTIQTKFNQATKTEYNGTNEFTSSQNFYYENADHIMKTKELVTNSKNEVVSSEYKYPFDFSSTSQYQEMVLRHIINPVIEKIDRNVTLNKELFKQRTNFQLWVNNSLLLPSSTEQSHNGNSYETEVVVSQYDNKGNVLQFTGKDGVVVSYLWGYNKRHLVAKIIGASNTSAASYVSQAVLDNSSGLYTDEQIRTELNKIRTGLAGSGASVTTYTYAPLVGIISETDAGGKTIFYEYDNYSRLKNIKDYQGNIIKNFQYNYTNSCGPNCVALPMQTMNGSNTIGYPVGVFNVNNQLLGNATTQPEYVNLWNSNMANQAKGVLSPGSDALHFNLTLAANQTPPTAVTGLRFFQFDCDYTSIDAIRSVNAEFIDFGDGITLRLGASVNLTSMPANTTVNYFASDPIHAFPYIIHTYPNNNLKTLTLYHNDASEFPGLDNYYNPATSLIQAKNIRGNYPQYIARMGGSSYQQASMLTVANITNWNSITTIKRFGTGMGDGVNPTRNLGFAQDFMQNNKGLQEIVTSGSDYGFGGYRDLNFKISRLKSDWNTYFTDLKILNISEDHWDHENLSALTKLSDFILVAVREGHENTVAPPIPISVAVLDNVINQIAAGAGQFVNNGRIILRTGGTTRSSASNTAYNLLISKGWTCNISW